MLASFSTATMAALSMPLAANAAALREHIRAGIEDPNIALLLVFSGLIAIYAEFLLPGRVFPGVIGASGLVLGLHSLASLRITWLGTALALLSFPCYLLEARYSSRGLFTALGAVLMTLGLVALFDATAPGRHISVATALALAVPFSMTSSFLFSVARRAKKNKQFR